MKRAVALLLVAGLAAAALTGCGGGHSGSGGTSGGGSGSPPPVALPQPGPPLVRVSGTSPFTGSCGGPATTGETLYTNAEVEPHVAVNPASPLNLVGAWQQDRWSDGGAQGILVAVSFDGGESWHRQRLPFSQCAGGKYTRASDPWVAFSPDGVAYIIAIPFSGGESAAEPGAVSVVRSGDGGQTWGAPATLITDNGSQFNDKETVTADPRDSRYVYAVWDRLPSDTHSVTWFTRTTDGGASWEIARAIYDPGASKGTVGNQIAVLPDGTLVDLFTEWTSDAKGATTSAEFRVIRSSDRGATWSAPTTIAQNDAQGVYDPVDKKWIRDGSILAEMAMGADGTLYVAWQDNRFSASTARHDDIALSTSSDGGRTWTAPAAIDDPGLSKGSFTPAISVRSDGTIGIAYYDVETASFPDGLFPVNYWLAQSADGRRWSMSRISQPFDMGLAPDSEGLFLGDYDGLVALGSGFVPFFAQTNNNGTANRTGIYALPLSSQGQRAVRTVQARAIRPTALSAAVRKRVAQNLTRQREKRHHPPE